MRLPENETRVVDETESDACATPPSPVDDRGAPATGPPEGICANCTHRDGCSKRTSESGVWHCSDYEE